MKSSAKSENSNQKFVDENSDIKKLISELLDSWHWITLLVIVTLAVAWLYNRTATPVYQVESTIVIKTDKNASKKELFESIGLKTTDNIQNEVLILSSVSIASQTLKELDFDVEYFQEGTFNRREIYRTNPYKIEVDRNHNQILNRLFHVTILDKQTFKISSLAPSYLFLGFNVLSLFTASNEIPELNSVYKLGQWITTNNLRFRIVPNKLNKKPISKFEFQLLSNDRLAEKYSQKIKVENKDKESTILSLKLETTNISKTKVYLDKLMEIYQKRELMTKNLTSINTADFINGQLNSIKDSLTYFEDALQNYRTNNQSYDLDNQSSLILSRLSDLDNEKSLVNLKLKYYLNLQSYLKDEDINRLIVPSSVGIEEPVIEKLIGELITIQTDKLRLNQFLSEENRTLKDLNFRYSTVLSTLRESVARSYQTAKLSKIDLESRISSFNGELNTIPKLERSLLSIKRQYAISENIYTYLLQKRNEAEISKASNIPSSEVLDYARVKGNPISPKNIQSYLISTSISFILPLLFILIRRIFNNKVNDFKELEERLRIPIVGIIGKGQSNVKNVVVFNSPKSIVSENFRTIRASTKFLHTTETSVVIAFTSANSGEGKTFCSINGASIYALGGKRTVLVGADLRRPRIVDDFNLKNDLGLSNFLSSNIGINDIIKKSGYDNLDIILSGPLPPNPAELIASKRFSDLIQALRSVYDVIIIDCPPAGLVSETIDIFNHVDIVFLIFRHNYSYWSSVVLLNGMIEKMGANKSYAIYNDMPVKSGYEYEYYSNDNVVNSKWKVILDKVKTLLRI